MTTDFLLDYYTERIVIRVCNIFAPTFRNIKATRVFVIMEEALAVILPTVCEEEVEKGVIEKLYDVVSAGVESKGRADLVEFLEAGRQRSLTLTNNQKTKPATFVSP